ncbi:hypothetical protein Tco_0578612 [Tanacetum coccineum]
MGALPSDAVKNPKLNVNPTSPILSARSYPTEDPQCSAPIHSSINAITIYPKQPIKPYDDKPGENKIAKMGATDKDHHKMVRAESERKKSEGEERENINTDSPSQPDPSISFIIEKVRKLNSFLETSCLCDDPREEELRENEATRGLEVEYFDTFPTRSELAYHKYIMCGPIPSLFLRNPIIIEGCLSNLKIPCNIRHVHVEKAYIELNSPLNIMARMMYNWIMRRKLNPRKDTNKEVSNFKRRIKRIVRN